MMTLDKFEEASERVKEVILPTNLIYSEYYSKRTGGKIYFKQGHIRFVALIIRLVPYQKRNVKRDLLQHLPVTMPRVLLMPLRFME